MYLFAAAAMFGLQINIAWFTVVSAVFVSINLKLWFQNQEWSNGLEICHVVSPSPAGQSTSHRRSIFCGTPCRPLWTWYLRSHVGTYSIDPVTFQVDDALALVADGAHLAGQARLAHKTPSLVCILLLAQVARTVVTPREVWWVMRFPQELA